MPEKLPRYITTTLPYVNSDPHIGHAFELVSADAVARYWRELGYEVLANTGVDEHGQKIAQKADAAGQSRQDYVDHYASEFRKLETILGLSFDKFIRTTDKSHQLAAQELWRRCLASGDIYKKKYTGLYCVGCELFYKESELLTGNICPIHPKPCIEVEEENYFFRLSKYQDYLTTMLQTPGVVEPEWRRLEILKFVETGLDDFSISRERSRLDWGIPVPDDDNQVMYVWFDALTNYISTLGWPDEIGNFEKFWQGGETLQFAGKDQLRFQSVMWQAMLKSAGIKATDKIIYHGFINTNGQKMSKSLGNVISPYQLVEKFGTEATRYLFLRHVHPVDDTDVTWEKLNEWYIAGLVNGLGNLTARIMKMAETHLGKPVTIKQEARTEKDGWAEYNLQIVLDGIWSEIGTLDALITETEPFKLVKTESEKARELIETLVQKLFMVAVDLQPFMPETAKLIIEAIKTNKKPDNLFKRLEA